KEVRKKEPESGSRAGLSSPQMARCVEVDRGSLRWPFLFYRSGRCGRGNRRRDRWAWGCVGVPRTSSGRGYDSRTWRCSWRSASPWIEYRARQTASRAAAFPCQLVEAGDIVGYSLAASESAVFTGWRMSVYFLLLQSLTGNSHP